jgi:MtaA/CmuA family methyltransferase
MTGRERVLALLSGEETDSLPLMPITMMFASDHAGVCYKDYATDYRVLVAAQIKTAETFDFDYVSVISDPGREAADCGATVVYFDDQPPAIDEVNARLADKTDLLSLKMPDPLGGGRMHDRVQAAALFKEKVPNEKLIEGWVEGPCAEGADLRGINSLMMDFYDDPPFIHDLFAFNVEMALAFAKAQVDVGVDIIGVGDAAASLVGPQIYEEFVFPYEKKLVEGLHAMGTRVRLHICGNTTAILEGMGRLDCEIVDLDYMASLAEGRSAMGPKQVLLGNMDPVSVLRNGTLDEVRDTVAACHNDANGPYIVGAGCEIPRGTPHENVMALRDYARSH